MEGISLFFEGCASVFTLQGTVLLMGSTALGMLVGCLPGLSATLGIALLSSLTYTLDTTSAIIVLMGIYVGAIYGGSISAILINVPGTGSAAATALDGFPLAQRGFAGSTIRVTRAASMLGTLVGTLCLVTITPALTSLALQFTSIEFFLLALFGVLICGNVTTKDLSIKGWIAGGIGILISLVGCDSIQSMYRFTFDIPNLYSGVQLVPCMIGFFAFPQIVKTLRNGASGRHVDLEKNAQEDKNIRSIPMIIKHFGLIIKSCLIGIGVGALPGVGENVAAWIAYGHAKKSSKEPEMFGKGAFDAVIAPETANNAAIGGAMIPMLTLAVPGSPPAAVMLSALMLHGLKPGPRLTTTSPLLIYEIAAMLLGATVMLWIIGVIFSKPLTKVVAVPEGILMPIVAVLCVVGCYSLNLSMFDITLMLIFGVVAYGLDELGYSPATITLGVILGSLIDQNFRRALLANSGNLISMFTRPVALIFVIAIFWTLLGPLVSKKIKAQQKDIAANSGD